MESKNYFRWLENSRTNVSEDGILSAIKSKWDEAKHKRESRGRFATSGSTIEKQDSLSPDEGDDEVAKSAKEAGFSDVRRFKAEEMGVAMELGYGSVEEFREDKPNYRLFIESRKAMHEPPKFKGPSLSSILG